MRWLLPLLGACATQAVPDPPAPEEATMTAPDTVLLEMTVQFPRGAPSGLQVLGDGRYRSYSGQVFELDASQQVSARVGEPAWSTVYTFTGPEMERLQGAVRAAGFPGLQPRWPAPAGASDTGTLTWRARIDGRTWEVVVEGHPATRVPALDALFAEVNRIHAWPRESSTWTVRRGGRALERSVPCMAMEIPALLGVIQVLYDKRWSHPAGGGAAAGTDPSAALLEIAWREDGVLSSRTRLYADGRLTDERGGTESHKRTLDATGLARVGAALDALDRAPDPLCPQAT